MSAYENRSPVPATSGQLARWLMRVARPVLGPLVASTFFRILGQAAGIVLLVAAAGAVTAAALGELTRGIGSIVLLLAAVALVKALCSYLEQYTGHLVAFKALARLRSYFTTTWNPRHPRRFRAAGRAIFWHGARRTSTASRPSSHTRWLPR